MRRPAMMMPRALTGLGLAGLGLAGLGLAGLGLAGLGLAGCSNQVVADPCAQLVDEAQAALDAELSATWFAGATLAIDTPRCGLLTWSTGSASLEPAEPMTTDHTMPIASITKTFVGAVVMQLVDEGRLSLGDTLDAWFPTIPFASEITIRQMLAHWSGIRDYYTDPDCSPARLTMESTPEQLLACIASDPADRAPGVELEYSNSNYVLLSRIIELVEGRPLDTVIRARLLEPLGLTRTSSLFEPVIEPRARSYAASTDVTSEWSPTFAWGTGHLASSASDVARWIRALVTGDVVSPGSRASMQELRDAGVGWSYGLALEGDTVLDEGGAHVCSLIGHDGRGVAMSEAYYVAEWDATVVLMINERYASGTIELPNIMLENLMRALEPLMEEASR